MSEAAAIEKLDTLIGESQSQTEEAPKLYRLDQPEATVKLEVVYGDDSTLILRHKLRWPTLDALIKRQQQTPYRSEALGGGIVRARNDDGVTANAQLWDAFASEVQGYEWGDLDPDKWAPVTDELRTEIPSEHKSEAVVGLFASEFEIEQSKGKGFVLGAVAYKVKQTYGPYVIWHVFNKPSEKDRRDLARKSRETRNQPGARKAKTEIFTNLKPSVELYDKLFAGLEGVTGDDPNIARRKDLVSPIWKHAAITELMESFEAPRRDLLTN